MIGLGLSVVQIAVRQLVGGFSPASLFAANEPGVWYDPSDFSTMFQDAAGTTPVTAVEQPVGLILDKSKGLVLGPELVTNGGFDTDTAWTKSSATISGGVATLGPNAVESFILQNGVVSGAESKWYRIDWTQTFVSGGTSLLVYCGTTSSGDARYAISVSGNGTKTVYLQSLGAGTTYIRFRVGADIIATVDNISVRELPGNHATQTTATSRPVLKQDGNGKYYIRFDGVDDWLITPTITSGTDKVQVFAGVRKLSDAAGGGTLAELSVNSGTVNGAFLFAAPSGVANTYLYRNRGTLVTDALSPASYPAPVTNVLTGLGDISGDSTILRVNGTQAVINTGDQGTGNFLAYPLYIGRRGGTTVPFNGHLYSLIVRFGANLPTETIASTESWVNQRTGAY